MNFWILLILVWKLANYLRKHHKAKKVWIFSTPNWHIKLNYTKNILLHLQQNIFMSLAHIPPPPTRWEVCWKLWNGNNENNQKISPGTHSFQLFTSYFHTHTRSLSLLCTRHHHRCHSNNIELGKKKVFLSFEHLSSFVQCLQKLLWHVKGGWERNEMNCEEEKSILP